MPHNCLPIWCSNEFVKQTKIDQHKTKEKILIMSMLQIVRIATLNFSNKKPATMGTQLFIFKLHSNYIL